MSNRNGQKGSAFERLVADYWRDNWDDRIDRRVKTGAQDKGDLANVRVHRQRVVVEIKSWGTKDNPRMNPSGWVDEARKEAVNDGALCGIVVAKRYGKGKPEDQFVMMSQGDFLKLLAAVTCP